MTKKKKKPIKKEKRLLGYNLPLDIFDDNFTILFGEGKLLLQYIKDRKLDINLDSLEGIESGIVDGICFKDKNNKTHIWIGKDKKKYNVICHELMHAILTLTHERNLYCGDTPGNGEQELECYLTGYVMNYVLTKKKFYKWDSKKWI